MTRSVSSRTHWVRGIRVPYETILTHTLHTLKQYVFVTVPVAYEPAKHDLWVRELIEFVVFVYPTRNVHRTPYIPWFKEFLSQYPLRMSHEVTIVLKLKGRHSLCATFSTDHPCNVVSSCVSSSCQLIWSSWQWNGVRDNEYGVRDNEYRLYVNSSLWVIVPRLKELKHSFCATSSTEGILDMEFVLIRTEFVTIHLCEWLSRYKRSWSTVSAQHLPPRAFSSCLMYGLCDNEYGVRDNSYRVRYNSSLWVIVPI